MSKRLDILEQVLKIRKVSVILTNVINSIERAEGGIAPDAILEDLYDVEIELRNIARDLRGPL